MVRGLSGHTVRKGRRISPFGRAARWHRLERRRVAPISKTDALEAVCGIGGRRRPAAARLPPKVAVWFRFLAVWFRFLAVWFRFLAAWLRFLAVWFRFLAVWFRASLRPAARSRPIGAGSGPFSRRLDFARRRGAKSARAFCTQPASGRREARPAGRLPLCEGGRTTFCAAEGRPGACWGCGTQTLERNRERG